ncbi:MAG: hypothetical protein ACOH5I_17965 [Oligoflexus sp.]
MKWQATWIGIISLGIFALLPADIHADSLLPELGYAFYLPSDKQPSQTIAQATKKRRKTKRSKEKAPPAPPYYSSLGLGKTLPGGFYRFRSITRMGRGSVGYDDSGNEVDLGLELNTVVQAVVLEYGLTEELSFQILAPFVIKNQMALDYRRFNQTETFQTQVQQLNGLMYRSLIAAELCSSIETCQQAIDGGLELPAEAAITLPTGEKVPVGGGPLSAVQAQIPDLVKKAATPADGETGIGDVDFGVLYVFHSTRDSVYAIGGGLRLPTGSFENVPRAQRGTGEGLFKGAIRFNYDYNPFAPLWFSLQHQSEFMLMDGRKKKSSILNPNELNTSDPTSDAAIAAGSDGQPNSQVVKQKGMRHHGLLRLDYGFGGFVPALEPISTEFITIYDFGAETTIDGVASSPAPQSFRYSYGIKFDGLGLARPLPAYVKLSQERLISARNLPLFQNLVLVEFAFYTSF